LATAFIANTRLSDSTKLQLIIFRNYLLTILKDFLVHAQFVFATDPYKVTFGNLIEVLRSRPFVFRSIKIVWTHAFLRVGRFVAMEKNILIMKRCDTNLSEVTRMKKMERESRLK